MLSKRKNFLFGIIVLLSLFVFQPFNKVLAVTDIVSRASKRSI